MRSIDEKEITNWKIYGGLTSIIAECFDCGKVWDSRNAHGVAARHAQLTGHHTAVEVIHNYHYNAPAGDEE